MVPGRRVLHFSDAKLVDNRMIDGTPETPADALIDGTLPVGRTFADPINAEPAACTTSTTACVPVPLRLSWLAIPGPNGLPRSFAIQLDADTATLFNGTPTITWTASCSLTVDPSLLSATMPAPGCKVTVTLATSNKKLAVTAVPN